MAFLGIHHTTMVVPDLDKATEFYTRVLGFVVVQDVAIPDTADEVYGLHHAALVFPNLEEDTEYYIPNVPITSLG
jgi:catechol 2,3-dioxygenase-like lactoylglutathione lyase family enzyme